MDYDIVELVEALEECFTHPNAACYNTAGSEGLLRRLNEINRIVGTALRLDSNRCKFCGKGLTETDDYHAHHGGFVCSACWDDRLRSTE